MNPPPQKLLAPDALRGIRVGISVSETPDLGRLGLLETHFRLALGEVARSVLLLGGSLAYGGHLETTGYTPFLLSELKRYGRRDRPLLVCLAWSEHRRLPLSVLEGWRRDLGLYGDLRCFNAYGQSIDPSEGRREEAEPEGDPAVVAQSLTALRTAMIGLTQARVLIGGKRTDFQGKMPGILEEALLALEANQPLYLAGGFGGVSLDIIREFSPDAATWLPDYSPPEGQDPRYASGLRRLVMLLREKPRHCLKNGLTEEESSLLANTHRPSEIAALVSRGLGRVAQNGRG